jgi:SAM-dependent methyltransferase
MTLAYSERRRLLDRCLARHAHLIRGTVLEVGGGQASRRGRFAPPVGQARRWWYLDLSARPAPHVVADFCALPLCAASMDTVLAIEVLEYVGDPSRAIDEAHRVLRPGGHLLLSVPFVHRMDGPADRWRFSERGLADLLHAAGFEVLAVEPQGHLVAALTHLVGSVIAQRTRRIERWLLGALALPLAGLARCEPHLVRRGGATGVTTGYLAVGRR